MIDRLHRQPDLESVLNAAVVDAVALHGAEFGNLQLRCADGTLVIVAHAGLSQSFLESFGRVALDDGTACARAARERKTVLIEDVEQDQDFRSFLKFARGARFRSVVSSPLVLANRSCLGVISVHFAMPHLPSLIEIDTFEAYCKEAAEHLAKTIGTADRTETAERFYAGLLSVADKTQKASFARG
jgi:GAF domain-containing protein